MLNNVPDNAIPIQMQPQWQSVSGILQQGSRPYPVVPPGLESLVEVDELTLEKMVFQTNGGKILYSVHKGWRCCGTPLILKFKDPCGQEVVRANLLYEGRGCYSVCKELQVEAPPEHPIGFVKHSYSNGCLQFSIKDDQGKPIFTTQTSAYAFLEIPIQICGTHGSHVVSQITKTDGKGSQILIQFPKDLDAKMKALILGTFLYMKYWAYSINNRRPSPTSGTF
ncbi:phospholipid scramblase 2 [Xenopus laevis]|uniref:Phospholipid scramblase n=1 Tax=Xenopus laevis TaxID=8355 RepID=A0A8J0TUU0_XENLA|nr:phospholipid scramblase 2 [Xenopus laevis]OCT59534.1 hypothetical protein XELAEV_18000956mg [Xenopus laevis]